jgi:hypothetical protein
MGLATHLVLYGNYLQCVSIQKPGVQSGYGHSPLGRRKHKPGGASPRSLEYNISIHTTEKGEELYNFKQSTHNLQPAKSYNCTQLTPKIAGVVPPEDGRLTPETCRGSTHNKVIVKVKVY